MKNYQNFLKENVVEVSDKTQTQTQTTDIQTKGSPSLIDLLKSDKVEIKESEKTKAEIFPKLKKDLAEKIKTSKKIFDLKKYRVIFGKESANKLAEEIGIKVKFQ
jgi:hypothetical protein